MTETAAVEISVGDRPVALQVAEATSRGRVRVTGRITEIETVQLGSGRALRCVLDDQSGQLDAYFLGRSRVGGLDVGAVCEIDGTARAAAGRLVVWNPLYRILSGAPGGSRTVVPEGSLAPPPTDARQPKADGASASRLEPVTVSSGLPERARGHLRVYLGAAAGSGKTLRMLDDARRLRAGGSDVVVGFVETHDRTETARHGDGLEVVPLRRVDYRGAQFEEMDLEAVLERRPGVVLVDEMAHANVSERGRHEKRWQDVVDLLGAGIDVMTTVNIQHVESLADGVELLTGVPVRERVPDWVVRRADRIELVDVSAEQLRNRVMNGGLYGGGRMTQALSGFFRSENLTALSELARRFASHASEEDLLAYLQGVVAARSGRPAEQVMVAVGGPGTEAVVRRAWRLAAAVKAELHAVHVVQTGFGHNSCEDLTRVQSLVSAVGASWHEVRSDDVAGALVNFARRREVTQIMLGSSQRRRWQEITSGGSTVRRVTVLANGADVDVHIIAARGDEPG